jgi:DNA-binding FrmR family transcriptional regulator
MGGNLMEYDDQLKNRIKRVEGQVRGILKMMDEGKECKELVSQMSAVRSALDRAIGVVVSSNLEKCVRLQIERGEDTEDLIQEAVNLLVKSR